jgi:hypothetical protein
MKWCAVEFGKCIIKRQTWRSGGMNSCILNLWHQIHVAYQFPSGRSRHYWMGGSVSCTAEVNTTTTKTVSACNLTVIDRSFHCNMIYDCKQSLILHVVVLRHCLLSSSRKLYYMSCRLAWHSWLRHCATSWKVAGSIHDGVIGNFSLN